MQEFKAAEVLLFHTLKDEINQIHYLPYCRSSQQNLDYIEKLTMDHGFN